MSSIEEIKQRIDIVDLVSSYVTLKKTGRSLKGLCPFHNEKTPSFIVTPEKQEWHCFGSCSTGGDIFTFLMKKEGIDFGEALRRLAERAGVVLEKRLIQPEENKKKERLLQINGDTANFFANVLLSSHQGESARNYLEGRSIQKETLISFQLGFSPDSWDTLRSYLIGKGYSEQECLDAGVLIERQGGGTYDRFRNRLMFPVKNSDGQIVGFGARTLGKDQPKYLNSPQTILFDKSSLLYGLDQARNVIRTLDLAIIVEGYTDVLIAHQFGIRNVVASLGTALTEKHFALLKRLTKNVSFALDPDAAGDEAVARGLAVASDVFDQKTTPVPTWRGLIKFENTLDANIKVISLPRGKDPDEVILEDANTWHELVHAALPVKDHLFNKTVAEIDPGNPKEKSAVVLRVLEIVSQIDDRVQRAHYLQRLSRLAQIDERTLQSALAEIRPDRRRSTSSSAKASIAAVFGKEDRLEEYCLSLLIRYPELAREGNSLSEEDFRRTENKAVFLAWQESPESGTLQEQIDESLSDHYRELVTRDEPQLDYATVPEAFAQSVQKLHERNLKENLTRIAGVCQEAELHGDTEQLAELTQLQLNLSLRLNELFKKRAERRRLRGFLS